MAIGPDHRYERRHANGHDPAPRKEKPRASTDDVVVITNSLQLYHDLAAGTDGVFVLTVIDPRSGKVRPQQFVIGDVAGMAAEAVARGRNSNVYFAPAVLRKGLPPGARGGVEDIVAVLGLVIDDDGDTGKRATLPPGIAPSIELTTSVHPSINRQIHFVFNRPLPPTEAKALAALLHRKCGGDHGTGDIGHVWRLPTTLNHPNRAKLARGRPVEPQRVELSGGSFEQIDQNTLRCALEAMPDLQPQADRASAQSGGDAHHSTDRDKILARLPSWLRQLIEQETGRKGDRSSHCHQVMQALFKHGLSDTEVRLVAEGAPFANKYHSRGDLDAEIARERVKSERSGAKSHANAQNNPWEDPDWSILDDRRGDLPGFPIDTLTRPWRDWLGRASHGAGVTPEQVVVPLLGVASSLLGTARRVRASRAWSEPLSLWTSVVGFSGSGKTPGLDVTKRALATIERSRKHKLGELQRAHERRAEAAKVASKKWKTEVQEAVESGRPAPEMPPEAMPPGEFVAPRLYASDATIERLAVLLQARPRGMVMICDELAGLFLNMGRYSNGSDREFWLEAWNGGHYVVERQGRPPVELDHLLIGMTGGFQPDKLARSFEGDDDGIYARPLFSWPQEPEFQLLSNEVAEVEPEFQTALMRLIDLPSEEDGVFVVRHVPLSGDAVEMFEQFRQVLYTGKAQLDGREREWWAKGGTHVLRLAGTLCYLHWSMTDSEEPKEVAAEFIASAVKLWCDYFWPHARAALRQVGLSDRHLNARRTLRWIRAHNMHQVSREDVRRDALSQRLDAEQTQDLIDSLVNGGWLRKNTKQTRGRYAHRWNVNPKLFVQ